MISRIVILYSCLYLSFANVAAFFVSLFIVMPIIMCVYCCSCCTFCTVAWLVTCIHRWGTRWRRNNDPTIVEVIDPQQVGAPGNIINSGPPMPPDGIDVPPPYSLAAASPSAPPPLTPDSQEVTSVDPKQEQVGDIDHEKED
ncbi:hypothetical protein GBAR_LOCUS3098 [Geodia barretti]|uniref:Uncharacterized protein n=1 Tax=Geodia barretti TaxID=519541 RepID=A0AA35R3K1_GEOBA|nr:hypothetical protein GBAR_LOCUS3098 [Geodia barretti]